MKLKKSIHAITFLFALALILSLAACARKERPERVVARVNNYAMTVEDFNYESKDVLRMSKILGEVSITKSDMLDALITKELFLQEAQKEDLDKDKDFMKTIELYWEQTLIKNLLTKKSKEMEKKIRVYENEITDYYNKMKYKIMAKVLVFTDERQARKLVGYSGDLVEHVRSTPREFSYGIPSRWYILGEDNTSLENSIFNIAPDKERDLVKLDGKWALIIIEERAPNTLQPLVVIRSDIERRITAQKEREIMQEWIDGLRSKARIRIDKRVLEELK